MASLPGLWLTLYDKRDPREYGFLSLFLSKFYHADPSLSRIRTPGKRQGEACQFVAGLSPLLDHAGAPGL